jgi:leader peptidase (prepilin peptidase)/N-methyltransferase
VGSVPFVILFSSLAGSIVGILWSLKVKQGMKTSIPFGPYLALAAIVYVLYGGEEIATLYFQLFGLEMFVD